MRTHVLVAATLAALAFGASAAPPADLALVRIPDSTTTFSEPVAVRAPKDGSNRLFVVQKGGVIRVIKNNVLLATPFLTKSVTTTSESGLLGLAFHPNFGKAGLPHNNEFYIFYTRPSGDPRLGSQPDQVVARHTVSPSNPDVANPTGTIVLRIPDLAGNHNGGDIHFGADGYLYISSGDGGPQSNPHGFAECLWLKPADNNKNSCGTNPSGTQYYLLGKMLRIDVDNRGGAVTSDMCGSNGISPAEYSIPGANPHTGTSNTCDEIWSRGFRNPWRFSFDRADNRMIIGDVGQNTYEEVTVEPGNSTGGSDHGWSRCEGRHYDDASGTGTTCPATTSTVAPVIEYSHSFGCAVVGGFVYRGPLPSMRGTYFYSDSCTGTLWWADTTGATWDSGGLNNTGLGSGGVYGFGEDENGEIYVAEGGGEIHRLAPNTIFTDGFED
ncbi:PQQ-dependent sugar dehydrogenase [Tahibacter amnicola]|uniref:PQQ-dependent sugar dehydrogenase n=1 Tax=Tahibacter amnicola TaxID=2976241 RepID=A0ABY6BEJ0_9GAMM|nr:PQQ-dependent sugar dehydrogenase [Tahibacter amnicola]UXI68451.1 PQQ-dependent sugar dehydrogenase [Tahibacter amnicola]